MPKNEDGEFELILGNKQLLGMFFVVVVLLGVFFVMGYLVGQRSAPLTVADSTPRKIDTKPAVVESPAPAPKQSAPETTPTPAPAPTSTAPQSEAPAAPAAVESAKTEPSNKPKPFEKSEPAKAKARTATQAPPQNEQLSGTYLQISATNKHDADAMVAVLRKNSFEATDVEVAEKPGTFRVVVGPTTDINKLRDELQKKSFDGTHAIKRQY